MAANDYQVERMPLIDFDGKFVGIVIAKRSFTIGEDRLAKPADDQVPVLFADELFEGDDPSLSPPKFESDVVVDKQKTDFIVHGTAYAPGGKRAERFDVQVVVGSHRRTLSIIGPRVAHWRKPQKETKKETVHSPPVFSEPQPVLEVPISYYYAYGGVARFRVPNADDVIEIPSPANPLGKGFCVQNSPEGLEGLELPLIEDPDAPLTPETIVQELGAVEKTPIAAGFGTFGKGWYPRVAYLGVMPYEVDRVRNTIRESAKTLDPEKDAAAIAMLSDFEPTVMAPEFFQCAAPGMTMPFLAGDESVTLRNMTPDGTFSFNLPGRVPLVKADLGDGPRPYASVLDTVVLMVEEMRLILTFRTRIPLAGQEQADSFPMAPIEVTDVDVIEYRQALIEQSEEKGLSPGY